MQTKIANCADTTQKMETKKSLQETEIGPIPDDWKVVRIGDVAEVKYGKAKPKTKGNIPVVGSSGIYGWTDKPLIEFPTLVVGRKGTAGEVHLLLSLCYPSDTTFYLKFFRNAPDLTYLFYYMQLNKLSGEHARTTLPSLQKGDLENYKFPYPTIAEQRKIAKVLGTIQRTIEQQDKIIEAAKNLKKSLMQKLFTEGVRGKEQQESEIGLIPKSWEVVGLGDIGNFQYGYTTSALKDPVGPKFLRITDIKDEGRVSWEEVPYCSIAESEFRKYKLQAGDILIARIGATTGKTCIIKEAPEAIFASYLIRMQVQESDKADPSFVYYFTNTPIYWAQINANKEGKLKKGVSASFLKTLKIPLSPIDEQREIAHTLSTVDKKTQVEEKRKASLRELFKTMLSKLMTGEIRLKDVEV